MDGATSYLEGRGITRDTVDRFQLGYDGSRLVIPYLTPAGPWHLKYRCIVDHEHEGHGKYSYDAGSDIHLFNASAVVTASSVVIVEGELDAIACEQYGIPAVAYPGTEMWKANRHWRWCFDSLDEIVVIADGDEPGRKAGAFVCDSLRNSVAADVKVVNMPGNDGMDANEFLNTYGEQEMLAEIGWLT